MDQAASAVAAPVAVGATSIAIAIANAVHPASFPTDGEQRASLSPEVWLTATEALAFAVTVADRHAFQIAGGEGRDAIMAIAAPHAVQLVGTLLGSTEEPECTLETLDEIGREYGGLESLFPGEGRPRPSVLEAAHLRILATGPADQDAEYAASVLLAMVTAVTGANLGDRISVQWAVRDYLT